MTQCRGRQSAHGRRMYYALVKILKVLLCGFLLPVVPMSSAFAQTSSNFTPGVRGGLGLFTITAPETIARGQWAMSASLSNYDYLTAPAPHLRPPSRRSYRDMDVDHSRAVVSATYGFSSRADVTLSLPYDRLYQNAGDLAGFINGQPHVGLLNEYGFGSPRITVKMRLHGTSTSPRSSSVTLVAEPAVFNDDKTTSGELNAGAGFQWRHGNVLVTADYLSTGDRSDFEIADELTVEAGLARPLRSGRTIFIAEVSGTVFLSGTSEPAERVFVVGGFRRFFRDRRWALDAGVRVNVTMIGSGNNSHPIGGLLALSYKP